MIAAAEKRSFKRDGFLVLPDALDGSTIDPARDAVREAVDQDDPFEAPERIEDAAERVEPDPLRALDGPLRSLAEQLVGEGTLAEPSGTPQVALRFPRRSPGSLGGVAGHLDGYGASFRETGEVSAFDVGATAYLTDVGDRGGGFTVWPGSHFEAAKYFTTHALETLGHACGAQLPTDLGEPEELTGEAGTVVLWHNKLAHAGGPNASGNVRIAAIRRFERRNPRPRDAADKPFKYWPGLEGAHVTPD